MRTNELSTMASTARQSGPADIARGIFTKYNAKVRHPFPAEQEPSALGIVRLVLFFNNKGDALLTQPLKEHLAA